MHGPELLEAARRADPAAASADSVEIAAAVRQLVGSGEARAALEILGRLGRCFLDAGELLAGSEVARLALAAPDDDQDPTWRIRVLCLDGLFAFRQGDRERSLERNDEALRLARASDDLLGECAAQTGHARIALRDGEYGLVIDISRQAYDKAVAAQDEVAASPPLHLLAAGTRLSGDHRAARGWYVESLEMARRLGNPTRVSQEQRNLGWVELHLGDADAAASRFRAAGAATDAYGEAWAQMEQAGIALVRGNVATARRLLGRARGSLAKARIVLDPDDQSELDWLTTELATR